MADPDVHRFIRPAHHFPVDLRRLQPYYPASLPRAQMAELVDALLSGSSAARRGGSSPLLGTKPLFGAVFFTSKIARNINKNNA